MLNVTIIVPCFNEEDAIPIYIKKADELFKDTDEYRFDFIFVDDGSKDRTLELLKKVALEHNNVSVISFSRNFGQDPAIEAALKKATGDVVIPMDIDLQDPPELVFKMLEKYKEGYDVVQAQRSSRESDSALKKNTSSGFYKVVNHIAGKEIMPSNVSQYKLLSRKAVKAILAMPEKISLLRSEVPFIGFKTAFVPFERKERSAGKTKYNFKKMFNLALRTISNSTYAPLDWALKFTIVEGSFSIVAFLTMLVLSIVSTCLTSSSLNNYSLIFWICTIIAAIFLALGILLGFQAVQNMYLKEVMANTQRRPSYLIDQQYESETSKKNRLEGEKSPFYTVPYDEMKFN